MTEIEDDADDGIVMAYGEAVNKYGRVVACSTTGREDTLINACPPPSTGLQTSTSTSGSTISTGTTSTSSRSSNCTKRSSSSGGIWAERRRIQIEKAREYIRQNFRTDDDEELMGGLEEVGLGGEQDDHMEEDEQVRTSMKGGHGRKRAKKRNPFIADECDVSKRGREEDDEEDVD